MDIQDLNQSEVTSQVAFQPTMVNQVNKGEHRQFELFRENIMFFFWASVIYAVVFVFARYKNRCGIVTPLYPIASIVYLFLCARKVEAKIKKGYLLPCIALVALGVNLCTTVDSIIIFLDLFAIFLLTVYLAFHLFYEDAEWGFMKYLSSIFWSNLYAVEFLPAIPVDLSAVRKDREKGKPINPMIRYILIGALICSPILLAVLLLLGSADYFFGQFLVSVILNPLEEVFHFDLGLPLVFVITLAGAYAFVKMLCRHRLSEQVKENKKNPAEIAVTVNIMLGVVYVIFSGFQIVTLFLGQGTLPEDYTYASYAREGFFQLVVVCLINMILVLLSIYLSRDSKVLRGCLTVICGCTYVMIASSAYRMYMYVKVYQLTYTRVFVFWALFVIFAVMCGVVIYIYKRNFKLFQYCMIVLIFLYVGYAYSRPEYLIAKNNLSLKYYASQSVDYQYLGKLSSVAAPAVVEAYIERDDHSIYMEALIDKYQKKNAQRKAKSTDDFRKINLSVYLAHKALCKVRN